MSKTHTGKPALTSRKHLEELTTTGIEVAWDDLTRSLYSSDAGLYRVLPQAIAVPRTSDELIRIVAACRRHGVPLTARGTGTSCAGNATGPGLVVDLKRHLTAIENVNPATRSATVQPGVIQADLQSAARAHELRFGPDPSTSDRCTIGGMIGNNACGPRALGYGRTSDNVIALEVITGTGEKLRLGPGAVPDTASMRRLRRLVDNNLALIRTEFGTFSRHVSGYSFEHLLPENGFDVAKFFAGTEGTLGIVTRAEVRLVRDLPHKKVIALGYASMPEAADDAPLLAAMSATAAEGLDRRIVEVVKRRQGAGAVPALPRGDAWMFVELVDTDPTTLAARAQDLIDRSHALEARIVENANDAAALWKIRADGAGLAETSLDRPAYGGWEDAAVPPARLGEYLREFEKLLAEHGLHALPYGHFGEGCVHCRIDFPLTEPGGALAYRAFVEDAAELVGRFGGSMSGEHGDGRARSALLRRMYSPEALQLMAQVKAIFDPDGILNPGIIVDPEDVTTALRAPQAAASTLSRTHLPFVEGVHRCSGVGKCLVDRTDGGKVMCPSYQATGDEKDATRGRARVLQELVNGELVDGWSHPAVTDALDLCLSCKGCSRDCPTGVDMATYKSIAIDERFRGRRRPRTHYTLGWLPRWGRLITGLRLGPLVNMLGRSRLPSLHRLIRHLAGIDHRREVPAFSRRSARWQARKMSPAPSSPSIAIWVDSFSDCFDDGRVEPAIQVLIEAGYAPEVIKRSACCGLTWISTGQRAGARRQMLAALDILAPIAEDGTPIVGLEPSCLATWRSDAAELIGDDPRTATVVASMRTLAEALSAAPTWEPPDLSGVEVIAQPHCHHSSVLGWDTDATLLAKTGATVTTLGGCCGLAGNFGVEKGHYDVSVKVAEHDLLPALREHPDALLLADGFSCRLQASELAGRTAISLAELLLGQRV